MSFRKFFSIRTAIKLMESKQLPPQFYFDDLFRYVKDYSHVFRTHTKGRWVNKNILEMFSKEFAAYDREYYKKAIEDGRIRVAGKTVGLDYILKENQPIEHEAVRKEPPVYKLPIQIIHEDKDFIVINKPPSLPVHVCGGYFHNTVLGIMKNELKYKELYTVHRLDRVTSGLLILAKSQDLAYKFQDDLKNNKVQKTYLARVFGDFPAEEGKEMLVDKSIYCISAKLGKYEFCKDEEEMKQKDGKPAETLIKKLWFDPKTNTSLLECKPITGKTHQIRVHCRSMGCSIVNDVPYGGKFVGNLIEKEFLKQMKESENKTKETHSLERTSKDDIEPNKKLKTEEISTSINLLRENDKEKIENVPAQEDEDEEGGRTFIREIWLHSTRYKYKDHVFEAPLPYWADKEYKFEWPNDPL